MWVLMHSTAAGERLPHALEAGQVYNLEPALAEELIEARAASAAPAPAAPANPRPGYEETAEENMERGGAKTATVEPSDKPEPPLMTRLTGKAAKAAAAKAAEEDAT